jgi:hypothetical protein
MKYYTYLDLDWQASSKKLKEYIYKDNPHLLIQATKGSWQVVDTEELLKKVPELVEMVRPLGVTIRYVAFFISNYPIGTIHIDADQYSKCRINVPIDNCENTETRFFQTTEEPVKIFQNNGVPLFQINPDKCVHVDQFYLTQPVLFRNTEPHQVISNNPIHPRISCTISLHEDLSYLLE